MFGDNGGMLGCTIGNPKYLGGLSRLLLDLSRLILDLMVDWQKILSPFEAYLNANSQILFPLELWFKSATNNNIN
jgi:hypothetical protein